MIALTEPTPISAAKKALRRDGMGYVFDAPEYNAQFRVDYLSTRSDEMHGEIAVTLNGRHVHLARFNLSSSTSRKTLDRTLKGATEGLEIPWEKLVEQLCVGVMRAERIGDPTQYPGQTTRRRLSYLIDHLLLQGKSNMLFAPGGAGKGFLSVGMCCAVAAPCSLADLSVIGTRPFYFDWEDDFDTFQERLNLVASGLGVQVPRIPYRRMRGVAAEKINEMARAIASEGATFGVIDSVSAAAGTVSEGTAWDSIAHRLFDALDQVPGMTWLLVDHVAGDKVKDPVGKAFGSIQKMNRVRNAWEMRSEQEPGSSVVHLRLTHAKWNHTGKKKPIGIRMEFSGESVSFTAEDASSSSTAVPLSIADKMAIELADGPLSTGILAQSLKVETATVRTALQRNEGRFRRDDRGFISLVAPASQPGEDTDELPF